MAGETVTTIFPGLCAAGCCTRKAKPATATIAAAAPTRTTSRRPRHPCAGREGRVRLPLRRLRTAPVRSLRLSNGTARDDPASSICVGRAGGGDGLVRSGEGATGLGRGPEASLGGGGGTAATGAGAFGGSSPGSEMRLVGRGVPTGV